MGVHDRAARGADPRRAAATAPGAREPQRGLRRAAGPAGGVVGAGGRVRRQRRRLPQLRARRRRGRAPGHRRARQRRPADAAGRADGARQPPGPSATRTSACRPTTSPSTSCASTPTCSPGSPPRSTRRSSTAATRSGCGGGRRRCSPSAGARASSYVDELWAGSEFVAETLAAASSTPVVHMPMPVTLPPVITPEREAIGLPDGFVFLLLYDFNSVLGRKNPLGLLEAFLRAFPDPAEGARLALKSINAEQHPNEHDQVRMAAKGHPHVHLLDYYVTPDEKNGMIAAADCYASLHRSEGFGITMAEAMLLGKPVVATALLRQPRLHDAGELVPRRPCAGADRPRQRPVPGGGRVGRARPRPRRAAAARGVRRPGRGAAARRDRRRRHPPRALRRGVGAGDGGAARAHPRRRCRPTTSIPPGWRRRRRRPRRSSSAAGQTVPRRQQLLAPRAARRGAAGDEAAHALRAAGRPRRHRRAPAPRARARVARGARRRARHP